MRPPGLDFNWMASDVRRLMRHAVHRMLARVYPR